jgi:chemotaxis protein methyltransferase CheR
MNAADFEFLCAFLKRRSGFVLAPGKSDMMRSRLEPVACRFGFRNVDALLAELRHEPEELSRAVTEAMTVNESSFFRDPACFDYVKNMMIPSLMKQRASTRRLRIWSAGCSSGQEAYSLAILLDQMKLAERGWKADLIATDLSSEMVARARDGLYRDYEVGRGLSAQMLLQYFTQSANQWRVCDRLRRMVSFRPFNLLDSFGWLGQIDIIFCRNVLLYFDAQERFYTQERLTRVLAPDGYLVLGAMEECTAGELSPAGSVRGLFARAQRMALLAS